MATKENVPSTEKREKPPEKEGPIIGRDPGDEDDVLCAICGKPDNSKIWTDTAPAWMRMHACVCVKS